MAFKLKCTTFVEMFLALLRPELARRHILQCSAHHRVHKYRSKLETFIGIQVSSSYITPLESWVMQFQRSIQGKNLSTPSLVFSKKIVYCSVDRSHRAE